MKVAPEPAAAGDRNALRVRLLADREAFVASADFAAARDALAAHLRRALAALEPACLGLYWAMRSESNAAAMLAADPAFDKVVRALPFARREPRAMEFRRWDGAPPALADECGIASVGGAPVEPDVVVVPCVGFTADGHRIGYGGGYYDRWLAAHAHVVAVGVAWSFAEVGRDVFAARSYDVPLALVVTEKGVVAS